MCFPYDEKKDPPAPIARIQLTSNLPHLLQSPDVATPIMEIEALLDTGAELSIVTRDTFREFEARFGSGHMYGFKYFLKSANGQAEPCKTCEIVILRGDHPCFEERTELEFGIMDGEQNILGRDFLRAYALVFDGPNKVWWATNKSCPDK